MRPIGFIFCCLSCWWWEGLCNPHPLFLGSRAVAAAVSAGQALWVGVIHSDPSGQGRDCPQRGVNTQQPAPPAPGRIAAWLLLPAHVWILINFSFLMKFDHVYYFTWLTAWYYFHVIDKAHISSSVFYFFRANLWNCVMWLILDLLVPIDV